MSPPVARPIEEWHDDLGPKLWWRFPVVEPPYCGTPGDSEWVDDYYTHFTDFAVPNQPASFECSHLRRIGEKQQGVHPREGCLDCNTWLGPLRLDGSSTC